MLFGRDVSKIPCFRNTLLYGISGGLGMGLGYFLFTSKVHSSCNFAVLSYFLIATGYWIHCRYEYSKAKFEMLRLQKLMRDQTMFEGTLIEKEIDKQLQSEKNDA